MKTMARILIVEDEANIALALEDDLKKEGHDVEVVGDGARACGRALEVAFDLILLDLMLPRKDGYEVCRDLRRARVRTPILMLTAKTQEAEKILGLELGADDYVTKPYSPRELRARIKALLRRAADEVPEVFCFGDVEVDFARYEVRRGGRVLKITPTEFKLLVALIRRRGRVLTRDQLLDLAWGPGVFITDRAVDNQIVNLRKKIEPKPAKPRYLHNVRCVGYRFDG
jgi:DNA-binding response OmpR family regulator